MDFLESLVSQIEALSPEIEITKAGLATYYQNQYGGLGKGGWKNRLTHDLADITGMKQKSLEKRFDPSRLNNVPRTQREKDQYKELADQIGLEAGRIPPKNGFLVSFDGEIKISNKCFPRHFSDLLIEGEDAVDLANDPTNFLLIFTEYFQGEEIAEDVCGQPEISITPAGEGAQQMTFEHGPQGANKAAAFFRK